MARVPQAEIDRIKREVDLAEQVRRCGVELKRHGADLIGLCPFHDDREPSLVITPKKNLWHCLGACGEGGSVIDWVMRMEGVSFRQAVEALRGGWSPSERARFGKPYAKSTAIVEEPLVTAEMSGAEMMEAVVDHYHQVLLGAPAALDYLTQRGLSSRELIEHFRLGFVDRTLGYRVPKRSQAGGAAVRDRLQELGILRASGHEHFRGSVVVPIADRSGRVVEIYGRRVQDEKLSRQLVHSYLPGPHAGVFNLAGLQAAAEQGSKEVILCEALIDAMTFWQAGFRHVTSSYGVNGFTSAHLEAFRALGIERVLIAYDRDAAGESAAEKLAAELRAEGLEAYRIQFPRGMDANAYALSTQPAPKALGLVIQQAAWLGKGEPSARPASVSPDPEPDLPAAAPPADASPAEAPSPAAEIDAEVTGDAVVIALGDRRYRVRGLAKNLAYDVLKVNLLVSREDAIWTDSFDLYAARSRLAFAKQAARELQVTERVIQKDLGQVLLKLEALQDAQIQSQTAVDEEPAEVEISEAEQAEALALLESPRLIDRLLEDFRLCGVVGEESNKLIGYLASISRKLESPLAVIVQSSSAAGKTSLMDAILAFVPEEERVQYSAMTGQSLFYMGETDLAHKILAIVEEEGAERASYALKLLQSEGELTIASTGKDPQSGRLVTQEYRVEGPVMIFLTTTAIDLDEELLNRCLVLSVDEGRSQTRAIHRLQRERRTLDGLFARRERDTLRRIHHNAQRLLRALPVVNPWAPSLTFIDDRPRTRRDHEKYLTLIDTIALLHQHQREVKTVERGGRQVEYLEVELTDIELANRLASETLSRSLDELPPQTRRFLSRLAAWVHQECSELGMDTTDYRFTARDAREALGTGPTQTWTHLDRLRELEYLVAHRGWGQAIVYELLFVDVDLGEDRLQLPGLIDVAELRQSTTTGELSGSVDSDSEPIRAAFGAFSEVSKVDKSRRINGKRESGSELSASSGIASREPTRASRPNVVEPAAAASP